MKKIIRKILKEDRQEQFLNKIIKVIKNDFPLFKNMKSYGFNLSKEELVYVLSGIFGEPVRKVGQTIYDEYGNILYYENSKGKWVKYEYDGNGNRIYLETSDGFWRKSEYDNNGNQIYYEDSDGEFYNYEDYR